MTMKNKKIHLGVLLYGTGHHQAAWRTKDSSIEQIGDIKYYQRLAKIAERGYFDIVFFADNQSFQGIDSNSIPAFWYDPLIKLTAIAQVTNHVGLVSTISSTFSNPFTAARQLLSLDHITKGRIGWNLVTSMTDAEAQNHSMDALPSHTKRYERAEEFAEVMEKLFLSWNKKDFIHNRHTGQLIDERKIQPFHHKGKYYQIAGPSTTPQSPQSRPVLMQAGASDQGIALAAKCAEAVYSVSWNLNQAKKFRKRMKQAIKVSDRPDRCVKIFPGLVTYVGKTKEEALAKKKKLDDQLPVKTALEQLSIFIQQDCSKWELDEKVPPLPAIEQFNGPKGRYQTILEIIKDKDPTVKELLSYLNAGGGHFTLIGTPEEIVDEMELWLNEGVAHGFNLMPPTLPGSLEDFVDLVVPELQKRGLFRNKYETSTLRSHLELK